MNPNEMVTVTKEEFFSYVGPRDIHPRSEPEKTTWETRDRTVVGVSQPGWKNPGAPSVYMLTRAALTKVPA